MKLKQVGKVRFEVRRTGFRAAVPPMSGGELGILLTSVSGVGQIHRRTLARFGFVYDVPLFRRFSTQAQLTTALAAT